MEETFLFFKNHYFVFAICELNQITIEILMTIIKVYLFIFFSSRYYKDCFTKHEQRKQGAVSGGNPGQRHGRPDGRLIGDHNGKHHADRRQRQSPTLPPE